MLAYVSYELFLGGEMASSPRRQRRSSAEAAPTAPTSSAPASDFVLPSLDQITHVATARRVYSLRGYSKHLFIPAADQAAQAAAVANGVDPVALRLFGTDVLVLIKASGTVRIIPMSSILEFTVEAAPTPSA